MYNYLNKAHIIPHSTSLTFFSNLITHCLVSKSQTFAKITHAQLIKVGFNRHTFLGNRFLELYSKVGSFDDALNVFDDIASKNCISWNIWLKGLFRFGRIDCARELFDEMPERDVVSWNSMISGYSSCGWDDYALKIFVEMQNEGVRPSGFTLSIMVSCVSCVCHGKEIHCCMIRSGFILSNVVLGNCLIDMYGKLGLVTYAFGVFLSMEELDIISWNSLIWACYETGYEQMALTQFFSLRSMGILPDQFTLSTVITTCSKLQNLEKGKQIFALCVKLGFVSNAIVSSAVIDLFSKCNRLDDSVKLFTELDRWDSAICNAMIASYAKNGFRDDAYQLCVLALRKTLKPTEFTLSSVLSSVSLPLPMERGTQVHCLIIKVGFESDHIVASALAEMYASFGLIDYSIKIFAIIDIKDLISYNTMILGLTQNGRLIEALHIFKELLYLGLKPDRITIAGFLSACTNGCFLDEGLNVFLSMEKEYGFTPTNEHYVCIVEMLSQAGIIEGAMDIVETMPYEEDSIIWGSILCACYVSGDLETAEMIAKMMVEMKPLSSLPYSILAKVYQKWERWDSIVKNRKALKDRGIITKLVGRSWILINNHVFVFKGNQLLHHGGEEIYSISRLITYDMEEKEDNVFQQYDY